MTYYMLPKNKTLKGGHLMTYYTKGQCAERHVFNTLPCYSKFTRSCRVSERREGKRERQVMPPFVLLIKFVLLYWWLMVFQVSFSLIFSTRHGDQNGRSLEHCCTSLVSYKSSLWCQKFIKLSLPPRFPLFWQTKQSMADCFLLYSLSIVLSESHVGFIAEFCYSMI